MFEYHIRPEDSGRFHQSVGAEAQALILGRDKNEGARSLSNSGFATEVLHQIRSYFLQAGGLKLLDGFNREPTKEGYLKFALIWNAQFAEFRKNLLRMGNSQFDREVLSIRDKLSGAVSLYFDGSQRDLNALSANKPLGRKLHRFQTGLVAADKKRLEINNTSELLAVATYIVSYVCFYTYYLPCKANRIGLSTSTNGGAELLGGFDDRLSRLGNFGQILAPLEKSNLSPDDRREVKQKIDSVANLYLEWLKIAD